MEFKVQSSQLVSMLKVVSKGIDSRDDSSFIYFKIEDNKLYVISSSVGSYFNGHIDITGYKKEDNEESVYYVDGDVLKRLASIFPDAPIAITFSINQASRVFVIKYAGHSFRLPIIADSQLQETETPKTVKLGLIQAPDFFSLLNSLVKIVDTDPASQETASSCLHLSFKNSKMAAMGTDKFAIAEITKDYTPDEDDQDYSILIRHGQAALLSKTVNPAEVLQLVYTPKMFGYIDGAGILSLVSRTNMNPIDYQQIKQVAGNDSSITIDYSDFKTTLDTIGKLAFETNTVILNLTDKKVKLMSTAGDVMDLAVSDIKGIGSEPEQFMFTLSVLGKALIPVDTHTIRIQWKKTDDTAGIFQVVPVDDDGKDEDNVFIGVVPNA